MMPLIPLAKPKLYEFSSVGSVKLVAGQTINEAVFIQIVGKKNVEHLKFVIGNYWEKKLVSLDTDKLFDELRILYRSKRKAKRTMNETREEVAARVIDYDWHKIWTTFCGKINRVLWRNAKGNVVAQVVHLQIADLVIEENSTCEVQFQGTRYTVDVEGRRSVIGNLTTIKGQRVRIMNIKNRFVGRTFWQCQGRSHEAEYQPDLFEEQQ